MSTDSTSAKNPEHSALDPSIKQQYEVIHKIGSGAYGHVWKVRHRQSQQIYAIKKVFLAFQNETDAQRIYRQIALLRKITHKNVIALKNIIQAPNGKDIYLLFQHMESDVFKAIKNRVLDAMHKKYIVYQLACGLKYLHSAGVLHRDLKPSNILINSQCQVKICDFGLSRTLESAFFNKPIMTEFIATRWYRAPEVVLGSRCYSTKSDMWSLGCLIYELYSRRTLLPGENTIDQITKIVQFRGKPTKQQILSLKAEKAQEILSFFQVSQKNIGYYYDDLQIQQIQPILDNLIQYHPDKRWSADQLLQSQFLKEFRDPKCEVEAQMAIHLGLNDNRKYKVERYQDQIVKFAGKNGGSSRRGSGSASKRLLLSYRNLNNKSGKGSMHSQTHSQSISQRVRPSMPLNAKFSGHYKTASNSPQPLQKGPTVSLHVSKRGSSLSNFKTTSMHKQSTSNLYIKPKVIKANELKPAPIKRKSSVQRLSSRSKLTVHQNKAKSGVTSGVITPNGKFNKQNYENRLRNLKKTQIRHYRGQSEQL